MNNDHILESALAELGLTPNAAQLYLQSMQTGRATVGRLASLCHMDRSSAGLAAEQLRTGGLLEEMTDGRRTLVWVKPPKEVLTRLRIRMRALRGHFDAVEDALPTLDAGYRERGTAAAVQVMSGHDGLRQVVANILEHAQGEILLMTNQTAERQVFTRHDHQDFIRERRHRSIPIRVLAADTADGRELLASDGANLRQTRLLSGDSQNLFQSETYIYGDQVAMLSFNSVVMGFVVRSADFAATQRWVFERLWQESAS